MPEPVVPESLPLSQQPESLRNLKAEELGNLAAVVAIAEILNGSQDLDTVLRESMDLALRTFGAQRGFLVLASEEGQSRVAVARGMDRETLEGGFSRTVVAKVLASGEPLLTYNASLDERLADSHSVKMQNARSIMCAPLQTPEKRVGVLYLDNLFTEGMFTQTQLELLRIIAGLAASAIERIRYFTALAEKTEHLVQAFRELDRVHQDLLHSYEDTVLRLSIAAEYRDEETWAHIQRVSRYCALLARRAGLPDDFVEQMQVASPLHDIGKIGIADAILRKPGRYTPDEFTAMKQHTLIGAKILAGSRSALIQLGEEIARTHHERWDGSGYPYGLRGDDIPLSGRIVAIVDVFDALTTERCYKRAYSPEEALAMIVEGRGTHFDPALVDCFVEALPEVLAIRAQFSEPPEVELSA